MPPSEDRKSSTNSCVLRSLDFLVCNSFRYYYRTGVGGYIFSIVKFPLWRNALSFE